MNKPVAYWVQTEQIDKLCDRFGQTLEKLTPREKANLRTVLSFWVSLQTFSQAHISAAFDAVEKAWEATSNTPHGLCSMDVIVSLEILEGITTSQANEVIRALSESLALDYK